MRRARPSRGGWGASTLRLPRVTCQAWLNPGRGARDAQLALGVLRLAAASGLRDRLAAVLARDPPATVPWAS